MIRYSGIMTLHSARILFHDEHFLAVNKLGGELVVKGKGKVGKLPLLDFLRKEIPGVRPVNRLDFETSGIVLFARSKEALEKAMEMPTKKTYLTIVRGRVKPSQGEIRKSLPARSGKGRCRPSRAIGFWSNSATVRWLNV